MSMWKGKITRRIMKKLKICNLHSQKTLYVLHYIIQYQATHRLNLQVKCISYCYIMIFVFVFMKIT